MTTVRRVSAVSERFLQIYYLVFNSSLFCVTTGPYSQLVYTSADAAIAMHEFIPRNPNATIVADDRASLEKKCVTCERIPTKVSNWDHRVLRLYSDILGKQETESHSGVNVRE